MGALYCESTKCHCIFYIQVVNPKLYESHSIFFKYHIRMGLKILRGKRYSQRRVSEASAGEEVEEGPGQRQPGWKRQRVCASDRGKGTNGAPQGHGTQGWEPMGDRRLTWALGGEGRWEGSED